MEENLRNINEKFEEKTENMRLNSVNSKTFFFFFFFFFCISKMYLISAKRYKNSGFNLLIIRKSNKIWACMKNVHDGLGVKNMSDLILKELYGKYERKNLMEKEIRKYKMTKKEFF